MENVIILILLIVAFAAIVYSIAITVKLFKGFTSENTETNDERIKRLKDYRKKIILSYAAAVVFITAAALVKIL